MIYDLEKLGHDVVAVLDDWKIVAKFWSESRDTFEAFMNFNVLRLPIIVVAYPNNLRFYLQALLEK